MAERHWVMEQGNCTIEYQFQALVQIVKRDIEEMNEFPTAVRRDYTFQPHDDDDRVRPMLTVQRYRTPDDPQDICRFMLDRQARDIVVTPHDRPQFQVVVRWSESDRTCHLYIKGEDTPSLLWQISQRALAPQFFGLECVK